MVISHNISALNTYKSLGVAGKKMNGSMEKLSSGYRINRAGDDAAGLSISEKMRSQIRGLAQASTNAENGVSMIQTAEGALNETHSILQRMRELAVEAATDTNATEDRAALNSEIKELTNEIQRIAKTTEFNGMRILDGSKSITPAKAAVGTEGDPGYKPATPEEDNSVYFHVGANMNQVINVEFKNMGIDGLGLGTITTDKDVATVGLDVSTREGANAALTAIDRAIKLVSEERSKYGAIQNRLEYTINNLNTTGENMTAAESTIRDVDMAEEIMEYTKNNILQQAAQAMLVQANQRPQQALQLLQ